MNYLQKYQKQLGLTPDGDLGPKTAKAMMADLGITDKLFFAHMMGQIVHESQGYTAARENLNYRLDRLIVVFKKYYKNKPLLAKEHAGHPEKIANYVYANRNGNGNEASGDGWRYRGIFGLQLTGKDNIVKFMQSIGLSPDLDPDIMLVNPRNYFLSGKFWFENNNVDTLCTSTSEECIVEVGVRVNGGYIGKEERIAKTEKVFKALGLA